MKANGLGLRGLRYDYLDWRMQTPRITVKGPRILQKSYTYPDILSLLRREVPGRLVEQIFNGQNSGHFASSMPEMASRVLVTRPSFEIIEKIRLSSQVYFHLIRCASPDHAVYSLLPNQADTDLSFGKSRVNVKY